MSTTFNDFFFLAKNFFAMLKRLRIDGDLLIDFSDIEFMKI